jgi:hypothetical protein
MRTVLIKIRIDLRHLLKNACTTLGEKTENVNTTLGELGEKIENVNTTLW